MELDTTIMQTKTVQNLVKVLESCSHYNLPSPLKREIEYILKLQDKAMNKVAINKTIVGRRFLNGK